MKVVVNLVRLEGKWDKELRFEAIGLAFGKDAHNGVRLTVQADRLADNVAVAAETLDPQTVGHDGNAVLAYDSFFGQNIPTQRKWSANHVVEAGSDQARLDHLGMVASGQAVAAASPGAEILKNGALVLPIQEIPGGNSVAVSIDLRPDN